MVEPSSEGEVENLLHNLGLCKYEARAYLALLNHGPQNYRGLIQHSGIPYGRIYSTTRSLAEKGWIKTMDRRPRIFYALDPETPLRNHLMRMKEEVDRLEKAIRRVSPKLKTLYNQSHSQKKASHPEETPVSLFAS